jgi:hypothetical protein
MRRLGLSLPPLCLLLLLLGAATAAKADPDPCRPAYVIPYSEQCDFAYRTIKKDASPQNVQAAFEACERAQTEAGNCLDAKTRQQHVVALAAMYRSVSEQADIALFAGQYVVAEALLREKLGLLDVAARESAPGDATVERERAAIKRDLAETAAGQCTERALIQAEPERGLARAHKYVDLEKLLARKYDDYTACANLTIVPQHKAYVEYLGLVALEEGGRAAQAAGQSDNAAKLFTACTEGAKRSSSYASNQTKKYLATVTTLCAGRMSGKWRFDQPEPLDADDGKFKPLSLPKT